MKFTRFISATCLAMLSLAAPAAPGPLDRPVIMTVGDSIAQGYGMALPSVLPPSTTWVVANEGRQSTGIVPRKDADWVYSSEHLAKSRRPSVVLLSFGANDVGMPLRDKGRMLQFGSPEWDAAYSKRLGAVISHLRETAGLVVWLPVPHVGEVRLESLLVRLRPVQAAAAEQAGAVLVELPEKDFSPRSKLRSKDGVHMTMNGYRSAVAHALRTAGAPSDLLPPRKSGTGEF